MEVRAHQRRVVYHVRDVVVKAIDLWCRPEAATVEDVEEAEAEEGAGGTGDTSQAQLMPPRSGPHPERLCEMCKIKRSPCWESKSK